MSGNSRINIIDEIKDRCNIVDVIGRVVPLKKAGSNYKGVCPFHNEKTPSFIVSESKQIFTCFGCGASGDVIEFVKRYYSLDFKGACEMIAKEYGISLEGAFNSSKDREELYEINRQAARYFYKAMRARRNAGYDYMKGRGMSDATLTKFGIGYADEEWTSLLDYMTGLGIPKDKLLSLGLISESKGKYYDKFRGRVIFPIQNVSGKVIGFGGRIIGEGEPKYLNSQESNVFQKKNNLYGLNVTKSEVGRESSIILVEGYMDAVSLYQSGVRNVAASLGTALTENQARLIKRYTDNVILSYDADAAGQNAAYRGLDILHKQGLKAKVLKVSDGKDPDEFIKKKGKKAFMELVDNAASYGDFKINYVMSKYNMEDEEQRIDFMDEAINMLHSMKPVEADIYASKLAEVSGISERNIKEQYYEGGGREQVPHRQSRSFDSENTWEEAKTSGRSRTTDGSTEAELMLLKLMIIDEKYMDIPEDIRDLVFTNDDTNSIYDALCQLGDTQRPIDMNQFIERLDQASIDCLARIEDKIIPGGKEEEIFSDCIWKIKQGELRRQEKDIEDMISIAEEEGNHQQLEELMEKLMTIQRKMKGI